MAKVKATFFNEKNRRRLFVAFFVLALLWVTAWLGARWLIVRSPLAQADAIIVLSGSSTLSERVQHAARLYSQNRSQKILLTTDNQKGSWSVAEQRNPFFHEFALKELARLGVPSRNVELLSPPVNSTWDEAKLLSEYSRSNNIRSLLIVTSAYHSRRALWTFRRFFRGSNTEVGVDPVETGMQTPPPETWWLHQRGWQLVLVEYFKLGYYLCRGR